MAQQEITPAQLVAWASAHDMALIPTPEYNRMCAALEAAQAEHEADYQGLFGHRR